MDQAPAAVLDHHEHVQQSECGGGGNQEIAGNDPLGAQAQKRRPSQVPFAVGPVGERADTSVQCAERPESPVLK